MKSLPMTSGFSFERFKQVTRRILVINQKTYALGIGGTLVGLYALWLLMMIFSSQSDSLKNSLTILALGTTIYHIAGYILTASIFNELHSVGSASQFLTLPATSGEKLSSAWIISFVLYTIVAIIGLSLLLFVIVLTGNIFFGLEFQSIFELINAYVNDISLTYLLFNSIFLLGAVYFRGNNFLKTAFSVLLFSMFVGFLAIVTLNFIESSNVWFTVAPLSLIDTDNKMLQILFQMLYTLPLTALFLTFSYIRLKNRQVA